MSSTDWNANNPSWRAVVDRVQNELIPELRDTAVVAAPLPRPAERVIDVDVKYALELGLWVLLDKPVVLLAGPGLSVPRKLEAVADAVVELDEVSDGWTGSIEHKVRLLNSSLGRFQVEEVD